MKKLFTLALFAMAFAANAAGPILSKPVLDGTDAFGANSIPNAYPLTPISTTAGPILPKPVLDGTNAFGANSIPHAFDLKTVDTTFGVLQSDDGTKVAQGTQDDRNDF